ncbi:hypothetical protein [Paraburkholderia hayleyella]|uniref:hypothetical protein n=1 Tax=Paraburkholderia hayleyella TaxID=2152889 RepID=UPI001290E718|nr:hypothetical protein [Paraburkholderia hayleyella]
MIKKLVYLACPLLFFSVPFNIHAFESDLNGGVVIDWMDFRNTLENYKRKIKLRGNVEQATEAEKRGRRYFLEGRYENAYFRGYQDAIGYIPRPEYFFIVGDIKLRTTLSLHSDSPHAPLEYTACWDKYQFAMDVNRDLESPFQTGFGLVAELNLSKTKDSKIYKQAMINASCFARLTSKYLEQMGPQCVSIEEVKACLGSPLLFLYY